MEIGAIIHEPLVPRTFRLLAESEKEGNGLVTYGLKDPNDNTFSHWNGSILLDDGRFYELQLECDEDYPNKPPKVKFVSKVNMPFVDQHNGLVKNGSLNILRNWNRDWDNYMSKNNKSVDEFVKLLSKKFKVIINEKINNNY